MYNRRKVLINEKQEKLIDLKEYKRGDFIERMYKIRGKKELLGTLTECRSTYRALTNTTHRWGKFLYNTDSKVLTILLMEEEKWGRKI